MKIRINEELEINNCTECPFVTKINKGNDTFHYFCNKLDKIIAYYVKTEEDIERMKKIEKECPVKI